MRRMLWWFGVAIVVCGVVLTLRAPWFFLRSSFIGTRLVTHEQRVLHKISQRQTSRVLTTALSGGVAPVSAPAREGTAIGLLEIPQLRLQAPVLEGDGNSVLSVAVGHLPGSALPGQMGMAVLAAHNATWFRSIDRLRKGAAVDVETAYGTFVFQVIDARVVRTGTAVSNSGTPSLLLETCYPLNALYLTPDRYLVTARMIREVASAAAVPISGLVNYQPASYLPAVGAAGLVPQFRNSGVPMGVLLYGSQPALSYRDSPAPLSAANLLARLYAAFLSVSSSGDTKAMQRLLVHDLRQNPFWRAPGNAIQYASLFNVKLHVSGSVLGSATASVAMTVNGRPVDVKILARVEGDRMSLQSVRTQ
ncbi:MAG: class D sortase [Bacilli bacterium]